MRQPTKTLLLAALLGSALMARAAEVGRPAPGFKLPGLSGKTISLSQYKGKPVVLEWVNEGCPFVRKHYGSGNMQALQKKYTDKGVVWLSISTSSEGREGYWPDGRAAADFKAAQKAAMTDILLDHDGTVGHAYGAKTTPHMFVINAKGTLVYAGAIDDKPGTNPADVATAKNWVAQALDEVLAKKKVSVPETRSYGCGVKYKD
jgi:peroxiredoxin